MTSTKETEFGLALKPEKRHSKPWRFEYRTSDEISPELLAAMLASGLFPRGRQTYLAPKQGTPVTKQESERAFSERLTNLTLAPTDKQIEEFARHSFTTIAVPLAGSYIKVIDISALKPKNPRAVLFHRFKNRGVLVGISSGRQPVSQSKEIVELEHPKDIEGLVVRFYTTGAEHKIPPFDPEIVPLYRADYYQTGPFAPGTGNIPQSLFIRNH